MRRATAALALCLLLLLALPGRTAATDVGELDVGRLRRVAEEMAEQIWSQYLLPYFGMGLVHRDQIVFLHGRGYIDEDEQAPFDPQQTVVRTASLAKLPTALTAAELLLQRGIDFASPVQNYIRSFRIPTHERSPISFLHLFTHSEGFEERSLGTRTVDATQLVPLRTFLSDSPPRTVYRPGMMITYGNWGSAVLGAAIEELTGQPFAEVVEERLLAPAGMESTSYLQPLPDELARRRAPDYLQIGDYQRSMEPTWTQLGPAAGMHSTVHDMITLAALLLNEGRIGSRGVLSPEVVERSIQTQFRVHERLPGSTLGFLEEEQNGIRLLIRDGDSDGVRSRLVLVPDAEVGLFVVTAGANSAPRIAATERFTSALRALLDCLGEETVSPDPQWATRETLHPFAGLYSYIQRPRHDVSRLPLQTSTLLRVRATDRGSIIVAPTASEPLGGLERTTEFVPIANNLFQATDRSLRIAFVRGTLGEVRYMFSGGGYHGSYEKLRPWERLYFALAGLVIPILLCAGETVRRTLRALRRAPSELEGRARLQRIAITVFAASITLFALLLFPAFSFADMTPGLPVWVQGLGAFTYLVFSLPLVALAAIVFTLGVGGRTVATGLAIQLPTAIMDRVLLGSAPILFVALYHWRLLGFWF